MIRAILFTVGILFSLNTMSQDEGKCRISFICPDNKDSFVSLAYHLGDKQYIKDTIFTDHNGEAVYEPEELLEEGLYMLVFPDNNLFEVIISNDQQFSIKVKKEDIINSLQFLDSEENEAFLKYRKKWMNFQERSGEYRERLRLLSNQDSINMLRTGLRQAEQEMLGYISETAGKYEGTLFSALLYSMLPVEMPEYRLDINAVNPDSLRWIMGYNFNKDHFFDNLNLSDPRLIRTPILYNKLNSFFSDVIIQAPDTIIKEARKIIHLASGNPETFRYVLAYLFNHFRNSQIMGHDAVVVMLADEYYLTGKADWADEEFIESLKKDVASIRPGLIGNKAVDLTMDTYSGMPRSIYDIDSEFTILYFWEPNCGFCKQVTPELRKFYMKHRNEGIEVFAVCTQDNREEWENYITDNELEWINGWDPGRVTHFDFYYNVKATPLIYVLNSDKEIIAKKIPVESLEGFINAYKRSKKD